MKPMIAIVLLLALPGATALVQDRKMVWPGEGTVEEDRNWTYSDPDIEFVKKRKVAVGNMRCTDNNNGSGFIMYTERSVNDRFNEDKEENDFRKHTATNFLCVKYMEDHWEYDCNWADEEQRASNQSWHPFLPDETDVLMAVVDFTNDTVALLNGTDKYKKFAGMTIGWALGDLGIYPNLDIDGKPDLGEFLINGSFFVPWPTDAKSVVVPKVQDFGQKVINNTIYEPVKTGNLRCTDNNTGPGFIMYSKTDVNKRWNIDRGEVDFRSHTAQNFVCIKYLDNNWWYDNNWEDEQDRPSNISWRIFMPEKTDILVASVDYTDDKVMDLKASNLTYRGITTGYKDGDLVFFADQKADSTEDDGEFRISGSLMAPWPVGPASTTTTTTTTTTGTTTTPIYLQPNPYGQDLLKLKPVNREVKSGVVRCTGKSADGPGFLMFSRQNVLTRFATPVGQLGIDPKKHTSTNLMFVRFYKDKWQYDAEGYNNGRWVDFLPVETDVVIAAVDFKKRAVRLMNGVRARSYGMQMGFVTGNVGLAIRNPKRTHEIHVTGGKFQSWGSGH